MAEVNPFRYRGYYFDTETGLYYLQSRYYDAEVGRFLNADGVLGANGDMHTYNLYAYCGNNPCSRVDESGMFWKWLVAAVVKEVAKIVVVVDHIVNAAIAISNDKYNKQTTRDTTAIIHRQRDIDMKFGTKTIATHGCGIVAVHNAIILAGASSRLSDVVRYMGVRDLTFGACGAYYWNLSKYLRSKGYRPSTNYFAFGRSADAAIKRSPHKVGVFAYWHGDPQGHYIAVKWNGSQFELYNYYRDETTPVYIDSLDTEMAQTNCTRLCLITF